MISWRGKDTYDAFDNQVHCLANHMNESDRCTRVKMDTVEWLMCHSNSASIECTKSHAEILHTAIDSFRLRLAVDPSHVYHRDMKLDAGSHSCLLNRASHRRMLNHWDMIERSLHPLHCHTRNNSRNILHEEKSPSFYCDRFAEHSVMHADRCLWKKKQTWSVSWITFHLHMRSRKKSSLSTYTSLRGRWEEVKKKRRLLHCSCLLHGSNTTKWNVLRHIF